MKEEPEEKTKKASPLVLRRAPFLAMISNRHRLPKSPLEDADQEGGETTDESTPTQAEEINFDAYLLGSDNRSSF